MLEAVVKALLQMVDILQWHQNLLYFYGGLFILSGIAHVITLILLFRKRR